MSLDRKLEKSILNVSCRAALSSYHLIGKKDKILADKAAVDTMRTELNKINMKGKIVIGDWASDDEGVNAGSVYVYDTPSVYTLYDAIDLQRGYK